MKLSKAFFLSIATALSVFAGPSLAADAVPEPHPSVVVQFGPGAARLSDAHKTALRSAVRDVLRTSPIDHVMIAAWSDRALPSRGEALSATDRGLAKERAAILREFMKSDMEIADVETYNMAETAHWLARTFGTKDAELKSIFTRAENAPVRRAEFRTARSRGGPARAVVVVVREPD